MNKLKNICFLITNRTNYSKLKPVALNLKKNKDLDINFILSSSSILHKYGDLKKNIINDGFKVDYEIDCSLINDAHSTMGLTFGLSSIQHSTYYHNSKIDYIITVGDRYDMLAPVIVAKYMNIKIIHLQGGEKSGSIDDTVRNLITLCSDLHFVCTDNSMKNLINLGIDQSTIFNFGCTAIENIINEVKNKEFSDIQFKTKNTPKIKNDEPYFIVMIHPNTKNELLEYDEVFKAIDKFNIKTFLFYPNIDANNSILLSKMQDKLKDPNYYIIKNLSVRNFGILLKYATCFIGNSSSGIRESASFKVPFINIGNRQINREQNNNTINCTNNYDSIINSIKKGIELKRKLNGKNIYYKKDSSRLIGSKIIEYIKSNEK